MQYFHLFQIVRFHHEKIAVVRQTFTVLSLPVSLIAEITEILRREGKRDKKSTRRSTEWFGAVLM